MMKQSVVLYANKSRPGAVTVHLYTNELNSDGVKVAACVRARSDLLTEAYCSVHLVFPHTRV